MRGGGKVMYVSLHRTARSVSPDSPAITRVFISSPSASLLPGFLPCTRETLSSPWPRTRRRADVIGGHPRARAVRPPRGPGDEPFLEALPAIYRYGSTVNCFGNVVEGAGPLARAGQERPPLLNNPAFPAPSPERPGSSVGRAAD